MQFIKDLQDIIKDLTPGQKTLVVLFIIFSSIFAEINSDRLYDTLVAFVFVIISSVVISKMDTKDFKVLEKNNEEKEKLIDQQKLTPKIGHRAMDEVLDAIYRCLPKAGKKVVDIDNKIFLEDMICSECRKFRIKIQEFWINGQFKSDDADKKILPKIYKNAKFSVFSTCIKAYVDIWKYDLGKDLMDAHKKSNASVTRVFIFNKISDVTKDDINIMKYQAEKNIRVHLNFEYEGGYKFEPNSEKDFTIIDGGEMIGCTLFVDPEVNELKISCPVCHYQIKCKETGCSSEIDQKLDNTSAIWYFKNETKKNIFIGIWNSLLEKSMPLTEFLEIYETIKV